MQDRYAGDIGDYLKLSLIRTIGLGRRLGIVWYRHPDERHNSDGRHTSYSRNPERWRHLDPEAFDLLAELVIGRRSIEALHGAFENGTSFAAEQVPGAGLSARERGTARGAWFCRVSNAVAGADIVFADPDNGLTTDEPHRRNVAKFAKQMPISEALSLAAGRTAILYHHNSRFKGGHDAEVDFWIGKLDRPTIAVRCNAFSCRTFFIVNPDPSIEKRAAEFARLWKDHNVRLHVADRA